MEQQCKLDIGIQFSITYTQKLNKLINFATNPKNYNEHFFEGHFL